MAERAAVTAVLLIMVMSICLYITENFIPIGKNMDFRDVCRSYLMKMEYKSGLSAEDCSSLETSLSNLGFDDISVAAPSSVKAGSMMTLDVRAVFNYKSLVSIFKRIERSHEMTYIRNAIARKVINR